MVVLKDKKPKKNKHQTQNIEENINIARGKNNMVISLEQREAYSE